ncbi:MAG: hypothetical protein HY855_07415 [Burkholderiales bacterium]|nr:hypothetical protein [Burkholderiales bacterium]
MKRRLLLGSAAAWPVAQALAQADAAPQAAWLVLEHQGRQLAWLDRDGRRIAQLDCPQPLRGSLRFSADRRRAACASDAGWLGLLDLPSARWLAQAEGGGRLGDFDLSADGHWLMAGWAEPALARLFDAALQPVRQWPIASADGRLQAPVACVAAATARRSFVLAPATLAQLWEISHDPRAEDFYEGLVHDFRMGEGVPKRGYLNPRRTLLPLPLERLWFDHEHTEIVATPQPAAAGGAEAAAVLQVVHLDVRRRIATVPLTGAPDPAAALALVHDGRRLLAVPNRTRPVLDLLDMATWRPARQLALPAPCQRLRAEPDGRHLWLLPGPGSPAGAHRLDSHSLALRPLPPALADTLAQAREVRFAADGQALLAIAGPAADRLLLADTRHDTPPKVLPSLQAVAVHALR